LRVAIFRSTFDNTLKVGSGGIAALYHLREGPRDI
jgi:hypothetical protein